MQTSVTLGDGCFAIKGAMVYLNAQPHSFGYADKLIANGIVKLEKGYKGKIVGMSSTGKIAVEFEERIWTKISSFSDHCHGKGKPSHCMYIPPAFLSKLESPEEEIPNKLDDEACQLIPQANRRRLLLLATF